MNSKAGVFSRRLNSSMKEKRIVLKMIMSASTAPSALMSAVNHMFAGLSMIRRPIPNGAVNPNASKIPAINAAHFP